MGFKPASKRKSKRDQGAADFTLSINRHLAFQMIDSALAQRRDKRPLRRTQRNTTSAASCPACTPGSRKRGMNRKKADQRTCVADVAGAGRGWNEDGHTRNAAWEDPHIVETKHGSRLWGKMVPGIFSSSLIVQNGLVLFTVLLISPYCITMLLYV